GIQWPWPREFSIADRRLPIHGGRSAPGKSAIKGVAAAGVARAAREDARPTEYARAEEDMVGRASSRAALRERRLFADGKFYTSDGRAKFLFDLPRPVAEPVDAEFPFILNTGRGTSAQWHTNTRTGKSAVLRTL